MTISERFLDIDSRLKKHDAERKFLEGELKALQAECEHPGLEEMSRFDRDYGAPPVTEYFCPCCRLRSPVRPR